MLEIVKRIVKIITITYIILNLFIIILYLCKIQPTIILTNSMKPKMPAGSISFVDRNYPFTKLKIKDIIVYNVPKQKVIHRIIGVTENGYKVKGDANENIDRATVTKDIYYGKCLFYIPKLGSFILKLQTSLGKICLIIFSILLVTSNYILDILVKKKKGQQKINN